MIAIETRYVPATNTKPRRIVAETCNGQRLLRSYDADLENTRDWHYKVAMELAEEMDWLGNGRWRLEGGSTKRGMVFVFVENERAQS